MSPLGRLLERYGPQSDRHAAWVALGGLGALGVAWELPSPDHALPGLWAVAVAIAVSAGALRYSPRIAAALAGLAALGCAVAGLGAWALGGWPLVGVSAVAAGVARAAGGPAVFSAGPVWLAARLVGATRPPAG
ncbi:MAG: hypothetical protein ABMA64_37730 [Myxococcota bacterium]